MSGAPRILLLTTGRPDMRAGTGICSGPGRGNCATPGFIRTDVGMPVADDRIDMCRTGPPCNATCEARPGTTPWTALPCPPTAGRFHTGTFHTGTGVRQEIAGLHTATDRFLYPGNFSPAFPPEFPEKSGRDWLAAHRPHSQPHCRFYPLQIWSGFMPCYQQVENRCFRQRRFTRADIPSGYPKVSAGVFHHPFRVFRPE